MLTVVRWFFTENPSVSAVGAYRRGGRQGATCKSPCLAYCVGVDIQHAVLEITQHKSDHHRDRVVAFMYGKFRLCRCGSCIAESPGNYKLECNLHT